MNCGFTYASSPERSAESRALSVVETLSQPLQPRLRIAELLQFYSETIHKRQIQTAHLALVFALVQIIQRPSSFESSAESAREDERQSEVIVLAANPHVRKEHQAGIIENRAVAFFHASSLEAR